MKPKNQKAFTFLEILLVIGIIAVLSAIVILAINPNKMLASARNTQRSSDLREINSALIQYYIDHNNYPASTTLLTSMTEICNTGSASATTTSVNGVDCSAAALVNLSDLVPTYLVSIPVDPRATSTVNTPPATPVRSGYRIIISANSNKPALEAVLAEQGVVVTIGDVPLVIADVCGMSGDVADLDCWSTSTSSKSWGPNFVTGASTSTSLFNGKSNTAILAALPANYPAADYCFNLIEGNVPAGTWYLPSSAELWAGWIALGSGPNFGGFADFQGYWSSTDYSDNSAYFMGAFRNGMSWYFKSTQYYVRCLR